MTVNRASEIYDILISECSADEQLRATFINYLVKSPPPNVCGFAYEFRFQGALRFGGKLHANHLGGSLHVTCYPEDRTPQRSAMIERANARLLELSERE